jgi:hypothetical protein
MKKYLLLAISILMVGACSSPKYAYNFDYHDYNSGKKNVANGLPPEESVIAVEYSPVTVDQNTLLASSKSETFYPAEEKPIVITREVALEKFNAMSKVEKKEFKSKIKTFIKEHKKSDVVSAQAKAGMGQDMKLAAIFGAVGIVLLIIGGDVLTIIGAVALLIGLYFFVRWLIHQ